MICTAGPYLEVLCATDFALIVCRSLKNHVLGAATVPSLGLLRCTLWSITSICMYFVIFHSARKATPNDKTPHHHHWQLLRRRPYSSYNLELTSQHQHGRALCEAHATTKASSTVIARLPEEERWSPVGAHYLTRCFVNYVHPADVA